MARKAEPGISYYPVKVNHTQNNKIKLLFNEFGPEGYWVWMCLLDRIYEDKGYYLDISDPDEMELFAGDICKLKVDRVTKVIAGCIKRGLFDKGVAEKFKVLTSDRIQLNYLEATGQRRKKGTEISLSCNYLLIDKDENWRNVIITGNNPIPPGNNQIDHGHSTQSIVEKSRVEESKVYSFGNELPELESGDKIEELKNLKKSYSEIVKTKVNILAFIKDFLPTFSAPYADAWNLFAAEYNRPRILLPLTQKRDQQLTTRLRDEKFNFINILVAAKGSEYLLNSNWFAFDWIIKNDSNYLKILEGNYQQVAQPVKSKLKISVGSEIKKARETSTAEVLQ